MTVLSRSGSVELVTNLIPLPGLLGPVALLRVLATAVRFWSASARPMLAVECMMACIHRLRRRCRKVTWQCEKGCMLVLTYVYS